MKPRYPCRLLAYICRGLVRKSCPYGVCFFVRSASACWSEGLSILLKSSDVLNHWRAVLKSPHTALKDLGYQRLWTAFVLSARLAK